MSLIKYIVVEMEFEFVSLLCCLKNLPEFTEIYYHKILHNFVFLKVFSFIDNWIYWQNIVNFVHEQSPEQNVYLFVYKGLSSN